MPTSRINKSAGFYYSTVLDPSMFKFSAQCFSQASTRIDNPYHTFMACDIVTSQ